MVDVLSVDIDEIDFEAATVTDHPSHDLRWLKTLQDGLGQKPFLLRALVEGEFVGELPLMLVHGPIFGRFLVSMPYINSAGVSAVSPGAETALIDRAVAMTRDLNCRYLELRHENHLTHESLNGELASKVQMRLTLPDNVERLRSNLKASVRNQVKKR